MKSSSYRNLAFTLMALVFMLPGAAYGQAGLGLAQAGPTGVGIPPATLFPSWYMDTNGIALEPCLDGPPLCLSSQADLANRNIGEAFYWSASADLLDATTGANGLVEVALEMAFLNPRPTVANAMVFNRVRVRLNALPSAGPFTITHPFGSVTQTAVDAGDGTFEIDFTEDLPGSSGPASFTGVMSAPNIGPFLQQVGAPAGFLGNPGGAPSALVTPGPGGGAVTVVGPLVNMTTTDFLIEGKIATNGGLSGVTASYARDAGGGKALTVNASSINNQTIVARVGPRRTRVVLAPVLNQPGSYSSTTLFGANRVLSPLIVTNLTDASHPRVVISLVPDQVTISSASWDATTNTLTVSATSSETAAPPPRLSLKDPVSGAVLARQRGTLNASIVSPFRPARVLVTSSAGGSASATVTVPPPVGP